ncbi:MAG: ankyrin repeat domain-containing protein [Wolbachia endosymbiont of Fragariocoptes setiger]|nr:ankyrin repeat domain-containing protein [Wolbachia endosymbiont of Fragariocoptes setiger]
MEDDYTENGCLLVNAAKRGVLDRVKFYLEEENVDIDSTNRTGCTALHEASGNGYIEIVNYLISRGADVNITESHRSDLRFRPITPLVCSVSSGHVEVAKILIQNGAKTDTIVEGRNLLDEAIFSNNPEMISLVMSHGFDINRHNDLGMTPLATAMSLAVDKSIKFLLENGADYKKTSVSKRFLPIYYGISHNRESIRCVELLLNYIEQKEGRKGVVDYINSNDNSEGFTTLHEACRSEHYDAVKLFLECGADPDIRDKKGEKPYDFLPVVRVSHVCKQIKALFESDKQHSR